MIKVSYAVEVDLPCPVCDSHDHEGTGNWQVLTATMFRDGSTPIVPGIKAEDMPPAVFDNFDEAEAIKAIAVHNWPQYRWRIVRHEETVTLLPVTLYTPEGYTAADTLTDESIIEFLED